jgi:hypothetical protein
MTRNAYGVEAHIDGNFEDWEWADYAPMDLVRAISVAAAKTVLHYIGDNAMCRIDAGPDDGCVVYLSFGTEMGDLSISFAELVDDWIRDCADDGPVVVPHMIAALEAALAKIRRVSPDASPAED